MIDNSDNAARPVEKQIAHIDNLTSMGRGNWIGLLLYLSFAFVTVLGVEDADFFVQSRQTQLPLVQVSIPTFSFFTFAPLLAAALYIYLHLTIRKLTEALSRPPVRVGPDLLEARVSPWILNDLVLRMRPPDANGNRAARPRELDFVSSLSAIVLIWMAAPVFLFMTWLRSWPAHSEWLSLSIVICFLATLYAGMVSWSKLRQDAIGRPGIFTTRRRDNLLILVALLMIATTWGQTEIGVPRILSLNALADAIGLDGDDDEDDDDDLDDEEDGFETTRSARENAEDVPWWKDRVLAPADLSGQRYSVLPPEVADPSVGRQRYRTEWCARQNLSPLICGQPAQPGEAIPEAQWRARQSWCSQSSIVASECGSHFATLDDAFLEEWSELRKATIEALPKPSFAGADLRGADLSDSDLTGIDFSGARLNRANLSEIQAERANFSDADLTEANLSEAVLQKSDLEGATLTRANLSEAFLQGADMSSAVMDNAHLTAANLQDADLTAAMMQGASLWQAHLQGADFEDAQMQGADLSETRMQGSALVAAQLQNANFARAHLGGANLRNAQLQGADFWLADMPTAVLAGAQMQETNLLQTQMQGADLSGTNFTGASLADAHLSYARAFGTDFRTFAWLSQEVLSSIVGDDRTLLPERLEDGSLPFVCSCRAIRFDGEISAALSNSDAESLCEPGQLPQKTGLPWPVGEAPPWDRNPNWKAPDRGTCDAP